MEPLKIPSTRLSGAQFYPDGTCFTEKAQTDTNIERTPRDAAVILLQLMSAVAKIHVTTLSDPNTRPPELIIRIDTSPAI